MSEQENCNNDIVTVKILARCVMQTGATYHKGAGLFVLF